MREILGIKKYILVISYLFRAISNTIAPRTRIFCPRQIFCPRPSASDKNRPRTKNYRSRGYTVGYSPRRFDITYTYIFIYIYIAVLLSYCATFHTSTTLLLLASLVTAMMLNETNGYIHMSPCIQSKPYYLC